jgi:site-specific recombinase XerD
MTLTLYRRHRTKCEGGHDEDARSGQFEEGRRGWKKCACSIHASGTLGGKFHRRDTGRSDWGEAKAVVAVWEAAHSWNGPAPAEPAPAEPAPGTHGVTIAEATESFIANRLSRGIEPSTLAKYQTFVKQLRAYCDSRGYLRLQQLTVLDMDRFYASWKDGKRAKAKKLERLKGFIKFFLKRKWLTENIAEDLEAPEGSSIPVNKMPFTDSELNRIYAACDAIGKPIPPGPGHREWGGEDVKDFILLSIYTGLRISDVATFDISQRLKGNDIYLRMHKTKKELYTWIPDWLVNRLRARERTHGTLLFRCGESRDMRTMAELWRVKLAKVFKLAGDFEERPTPHRFRHTFVRILLEHGVPIADVAELIGDTEAVVRKHYAKWVPERQARLTNILRDAFDEKPRPKLVAIK